MESNEESLKRKLIREQDLVGLYSIASKNRSLEIMSEYWKSPKIYYSGLRNHVLSEQEILKQYSLKNLLNLLFRPISDKNKRKALMRLIERKLQTEDFFIEDIDINFFMKKIYSSDVIFGNLGDEIQKQVKEKIMDRLANVKGTKVEGIAKKIRHCTDAANFLKYFEDGVFTDDKVDLLEEMLGENKDALRHVNFGLFQDDIFYTNSIFIKYISRFPQISTQLVILQKNNPQLCKLLLNRVKSYDDFKDNLEEIEILITYFTKRCFDLELDKLGNLSEKDIEDLVDCAINYSKYVRTYDNGLILVEYGENYEQRLNEEYNRRFQSAQSIEEKINVFLNKKYSMSIKEARTKLNEYASDLQNINGIQESDLAFIKEIEQVLNIQDPDKIEELFQKCEKTYRAQDVLQIQDRIAKQCAITYVDSMKKVQDTVSTAIQNQDNNEIEYIQFNGKRIPKIKLSGQFDLLVHSTDTAFTKEIKIDDDHDFVDAWKNSCEKSNHIISSCFINQDFLGCAPTYDNGVLYGFSTVSSEKIRLMGTTDINSYYKEFAYDAAKRKYMSAFTMPYSSRRVYNEFEIEREGTLPDYVIVFDDMTDAVKNNALRAASQFNIPILYIDKAEIEQQQIRNLKGMMNEFKINRDPSTLRRILNTYETNMAGWLLNRKDQEADKSHTRDIDNSRFENDFSLVWNEIYTMIDEYLQEIQNGNVQQNTNRDLATVMLTILQERQKYEENNGIKPISDTAISYDSDEMIEKINKTFEHTGAENLMVDLSTGITAEQYEINIQNLMGTALFGPNKVTTEDVSEAEKARKEITREGDKTQDE